MRPAALSIGRVSRSLNVGLPARKLLQILYGNAHELEEDISREYPRKVSNEIA